MPTFPAYCLAGAALVGHPQPLAFRKIRVCYKGSQPKVAAVAQAEGSAAGGGEAQPERITKVDGWLRPLTPAADEMPLAQVAPVAVPGVDHGEVEEGG